MIEPNPISWLQTFLPESLPLFQQIPIQKAAVDDFWKKTKQLNEQNKLLNHVEIRYLLDQWDIFAGKIQDVNNILYFQYINQTSNQEALSYYQQIISIHQHTLAYGAKKWQIFLQMLTDDELEKLSLPAPYQQALRQFQVQNASPKQQELRTDLNKLKGKFHQLNAQVHGRAHPQGSSPAALAQAMQTASRSQRKALWQATQTARHQLSHEFQDLFEAQVSLRHELARSARDTTYASYRFRELNRTVYQPADSLAFHAEMAAQLPTYMSKLLRMHRQQMGYNPLFPWDLAYIGKLPQPKLTTSTEIAKALAGVLGELKEDWQQEIIAMSEGGFLHLGQQLDKAPIGMTIPTHQLEFPVVMASYDGKAESLRQVAHELGHALHFTASKSQSLRALIPLPPETGEVVALTFELLFLSHASHVYASDAHIANILQFQLYRIFSLIAISLSLDAFQHEVYAHPEWDATERNTCWRAQYVRFHGTEICWDGLGQELEESWLKYFHLFEAPFYSIEYAMAQLAALQLWQQYLAEPAALLDRLQAMMQAGASRSVDALYAELGLAVFPDAKQIETLLGACLALYEKPFPTSPTQS